MSARLFGKTYVITFEELERYRTTSLGKPTLSDTSTISTVGLSFEPKRSRLMTVSSSSPTTSHGC